LSSEAPPPFNVLVAFPYVAEKTTFAMLEQFASLGSGVRWLCDSGAFTAWKSGNPITLDSYCAFLKSLPVTPWRYFALDVIGDGDATWRNYQEMLQRGFTPVPVFTRGEKLDMLERYYETSDLVAIGGLVSHVNPCKPYLKFLHKHLAGRHYHALGFSSMAWIKYLRPYSVDSSSWEAARRYGQLAIYRGSGKIDSLSRADVDKALRRGSGELIDRVRMLGFKPSELAKEESWRGGTALSARITTASWMWLSIDVEKVLKTKLFLAIAASFGGNYKPYLPDAYARALRAAGHPAQPALEARP
jgi:hypothetical protein